MSENNKTITTPPTFVNGVTPLNAENLNKLSTAITETKSQLEEIDKKIDLGNVLYNYPNEKVNIEFSKVSSNLQIKIKNDLWLVLQNGAGVDFTQSGVNCTLNTGKFDEVNKEYVFTLGQNEILVYNEKSNSINKRSNRLALISGDKQLAIARDGVCKSGLFKDIYNSMKENIITETSKNIFNMGYWKDVDAYISISKNIPSNECIITIKPRFEICLPNGKVILFNTTGADFQIPSGSFENSIFTFKIPHNKTLIYNIQTNSIEVSLHYSLIPNNSILLASASNGELQGGLFKELSLWFDNQYLKEKITQLENKSMGDMTSTTVLDTISYEEVIANKYRNDKYKTTYWLTKIPYKTLDDTIYKPQVGFIGATLNESLGKPSDINSLEGVPKGYALIELSDLNPKILLRQSFK